MNMGVGFLDDGLGGELGRHEVERGKQNGQNDDWSRRSTRRRGSATATMSATACGPLCPSIVVRCKNIF